jgi:hypothetical protein
MFSWFVEGGVVMLPLVAVGGLAVAAGIAAAAGVRRAAEAAAVLRTATWCLAGGGVAMDLRAVGGAVAEIEADALVTVLVVGARESLAPLMFGGAVTAASALLASVGALRRLGEAD